MLRVSPSADLAGLEWASALNGCLFVALGYGRAIGVSPVCSPACSPADCTKPRASPSPRAPTRRPSSRCPAWATCSPPWPGQTAPSAASAPPSDAARGSTRRDATRDCTSGDYPPARVVDFARAQRLDVTLLSTIADALEGKLKPAEILRAAHVAALTAPTHPTTSRRDINDGRAGEVCISGRGDGRGAARVAYDDRADGCGGVPARVVGAQRAHHLPRRSPRGGGLRRARARPVRRQDRPPRPTRPLG